MIKIGAIILAAGSSSRFGKPKQLLRFRGKTFLLRAVDAVTAAGCSPVTVVIGANRDPIATELNEARVFLVENTNWQRGIGSSIRAALQQSLETYPKLQAVVLLTCDQPFVDAPTIDCLKARHMETKKPIVASRYAKTLGIPALFQRAYFNELLTLDDNAGAKEVILTHPNDVAEYPFPNGAFDIDTMADYQRLVRQSGRA